MDIDNLRLFVMAAERLNISAAGRALGMAPAVASARLAKLEQELGVELLRRTTRKVSLSLDGSDFLPYAREILAQADAARAILGGTKAGPKGILRFAAPSSFAQRHIMPLLPEFHETYPELTLDLRLSDTRFDAIEGSFDLALRSAPLTDSSLRGRKLADDTRVLCAAPSYVAAHGLPQTPAALRDHHLIAWGDLEPRALIGPEGEAATLDPHEMTCRVIMDDGDAQREATLAGAGISINSLWSVSDELASGRLLRLLPGWRMNDRSVLWLVYPRSNVLTPKTRYFIDFLIAHLGNRPDWRD
ncbi:LysR family transcriptional regulator [Sulfitobacter sp. KE34]|uniref:LysR substrate-binding domain-containing protein n=1 Tax=Sulfitobacter faviae TaxID=1775881 RepID=A0AAX3LQV6_9RHOB|nr:MULTISPECIES: LysR family transcriptional regulator [Sulfitobacter]MDF3350932.1 LysR family transcriptional regulator [Sulfitobacter sp. KE12]MDF3354604.1 LysR family transcriptional regulator [Sulfitobacter sp. KE27]MDF3358252.1 LysR family transcriptional regulator [Sulfitobacter sp. KE33]MDF3361202.1 LysR family transcriptional regulator [Sulfitobacter sp. Ks41]MDF3365676.1 LysR family transcriptional regulator [Sulfitobacter sp. Ks34]